MEGKIVQPHTHNGIDSPLLPVKIIPVTGPPAWMGRHGEQVYEDTGTTFALWVWLGGAWRSTTLT